MSYTKIEEQLNKDGFVLELSVGVSMRPMLRERTDQLVIRKMEKEPKTNDVVLFKRKNGQYVLHRVVDKRKGFFLLRGDNCYGNEQVSYSQMIGRLDGFYRNDGYIDCDKSYPYRLYVALWRISYPVRYVFYRAFSISKRVINKLKRWKND